MPIRVLFFGATADIAGTRSRSIDIDLNSTASALVDDLATAHPALRKHKLLVSVNQEYVDHDTRLKDGDEVAIFTAVSGG